MRSTENKPEDASKRANARIIRRLVVVMIFMLAFGFSLVPLYRVICTATGLDGVTGDLDAKAANAMKVDKSRWVTIEFTGNEFQGLPWEFHPIVKKMRVHPGEIATVKYYVRNTTDETITGQAIPSITPDGSAEFFKKLECFCYSRQTLKPKESKELTVRYIVQPTLPADVGTLTLSYTFFNVDKASTKKYTEVSSVPAG